MFTQIVMWMFLFIFFSCAVIVIGSIPNWIPIDEKYKKWLFGILIVEVIGCVILFGKEVFFNYSNPRETLNEVLLNPEYRWYWQYSKNNWQTVIKFSHVKDEEYEFSGETIYLEKTYDEPPVISRWEGKDLVKITIETENIKFNAQRYWTEAAAEIYPSLAYEINKRVNVEITLSLGISLRGTITDSLSADQWGVVLIPGYPRQI